MIRRARLIAILLTLLPGAIGVIAATQTWLTVVLADGAHHTLPVPGASAIPVLAPLSLAVLALGGALSVVGLVLRYIFGALTLVLAGVLTMLTGAVVMGPHTSHVAATVTEATGITGEKAVAGLVETVEISVWPAVTLVCWIVLLIAGAFTIATAHRWKGAGRRYTTADTPGRTTPASTGSRPHDAIDDWDDLSRGEDPTT